MAKAKAGTRRRKTTPAADAAPDLAPVVWKGPLPPWLETAWQSLFEQLRRTPGATSWLILGPEGVGKAWLIQRLMQAVACTTLTPFWQDATRAHPPQACGECNGCRSFLAGQHSELLTVQPADPGKEILVDAIRALNDFLSLSCSGPWRAVSILPAEAMNVNAANALLKTLEEPPQRGLLILASARPGRLLPTIISRCQPIRISRPSEAIMLSWLTAAIAAQKAPGALPAQEALAAALYRPVQALAVALDPEAQAVWQQDKAVLEAVIMGDELMAVAKKIAASRLETLLPRLQGLLVAALRFAQSRQADSLARLFPAQDFMRFVQRREVRQWHDLYQHSLRWQQDAHVVLNAQLRSETMAMQLML